MTEENNQQQRQSLSQAVQGIRNVNPNDPAAEPVAQAAPVVTPESTPEVPAQSAPAENVQPESFTGNESVEDLNRVSTNPGTHNRIQKLAQERNAAAAAEGAMRQQLDAATQAQETLRQQLELAQGQQQPSVDQWAFKEPFPEEGTPEEQESHRFRKDAYERDTLPALQAMGKQVAQMAAPLQQEAAMRAIEVEWQGMEKIMADNGTSRAELEPMVLQILTSPQGAHRNVRSVSHDVMAQMGVFDRYVPTAENASVPGGGNAPPIVPASPQALHSDPRQAALIAARQRVANSNNPSVARSALSDVIRAHRTNE